MAITIASRSYHYKEKNLFERLLIAVVLLNSGMESLCELHTQNRRDSNSSKQGIGFRDGLRDMNDRTTSALPYGDFVSSIDRKESTTIICNYIAYRPAVAVCQMS